MLQNPKWDHGKVSGLIAWLEAQPRDGTYVWSDSCAIVGGCVMYQYMGEPIRDEWPEEMKAIWRGHDGFKIARGHNPNSGAPQTYGEALQRAYESRAAIIPCAIS